MAEMAEISREELKEEIHAILKTADLNVVSAKKIREQVEKKLNCSLLGRKKECDDIVMDYMTKETEEEEKKANNKSEEEKSAEEESASEEEEEVVIEKEKKPSKKKKAAAAATPAKAPSAAKKRAASAKKKKWSSNASDTGSTSDDNDSDYEQPKPKKKKAEKKKAAGGAEGVKRITGYTKALKLSPDLAALVGAEALSRHEVVKKVWAIIKERRLADPNNKQFTICDDQLYTVMKVKRFRTFGMLKHLKPHFLD